MISSLHRPTRAIIDLDAIKNNIMTVKFHIPKDKKTFAVVKANAYGHGAVKVAQSIHEIVDGFCVSNIDEALELREANIKEDILILGVTMPDEVALARKYNISLTVASQEWFELAKNQEVDLTDLQVHIKIDSGMGRIGLRNSDEANLLIANLQNEGVDVSGIFTHFATADEIDIRKFQEQLETFTDIVKHLTYKPEIVHASNSATSVWHSETIFSAVRLGIVMYGLNPSGNTLRMPFGIKPALNLVSSLVHVKKISSGDTVGYGATYTAAEDQYVAVVPIGYADGWTRDLQGFFVLVDGHFCEIIGRVSMDQISIRLPRKYAIGTQVTLIGENGGESISATDLAQKRGTINYEILCLLSDRIPRFFEAEL